MHVVPIAPPHLDTNERPSCAVRVNNEANNALNGILSGSADFNRSLSEELNSMRTTSQHDNIVLACTEQPGELRAQDDETDLGFRGFVSLSFPLLSDTHTAEAVFTYVDDFSPGVFEVVLDAARSAMAARQRTTLFVRMNISTDGLETDPRCTLLRDAGFELGLVEQASELDLALVTDPVLPEGLKSVYFDGWMPPEEHIESFLRVMEKGWADVPSAEELEPQTWTRDMIEELHELNAKSTKSIANALLVDSEGIAAYSCATLEPDRPELVSQQFTFVDRRVRGHGLGMLIKKVLYRELKDRYPALKRVTTYNALNNERMLAVNEKLGLQPKFHQTTWKLALS